MGSQPNPENKGECFYLILGGNCTGDSLKKTSWRRMRVQDCCHFSLAVSGDYSCWDREGSAFLFIKAGDEIPVLKCPLSYLKKSEILTFLLPAGYADCNKWQVGESSLFKTS